MNFKIKVKEWINYIEVCVDGSLYCRCTQLAVAKEIAKDIKEFLEKDGGLAEISIRTYAASKQ